MSDQDGHYPWVLRTEFSSDASWNEIRGLLSAPQKDPLSELEFTANLKFVEDASFAGMSAEDLVRALPADYVGFVVFVVDAACMQDKEHALLVVGFAPQSVEPADYDRAPGETPLEQIKAFRALPAMVQSIENNLSLANMDFEDFAGAVDPHGVFRGFSS